MRSLFYELEAYKIWWKGLEEAGCLEGFRDEGEMILKWILKKGAGLLWDVGCIHVTQDRNKCRAFVNTIMTIGV